MSGRYKGAMVYRIKNSMYAAVSLQGSHANFNS
jgi:hypothetical protein